MMEKWISPRPLIIGLTEFRLPHNVSQWYANQVIRCSSSGEYHLVVSASGSKAGVGFLVSTQLFPTAPLVVNVVVPGHILELQSKILYGSSCPLVRFVVFYGSNVLEERQAFEDKLTPYLSEATVLMGDFNAISRLKDTNIVSAKSLLWPWLVDVEGSCKLAEVIRLACNGSPPPNQGYVLWEYDEVFGSDLCLPSFVAVGEWFAFFVLQV